LVHLSVPAWTHSSKPTAACLLLWAWQAGDIDQLLSGMQQQQWQANLGSVALSASAGSCISILQRDIEADR